MLVTTTCLSTFFKLPGICLYLSTSVSTPRGSRRHLWFGRLQARQEEVTDCNLDSLAVETSDLSHELQDTFMDDRCAPQGCKMSHTLRSVGWWHLEAHSVGAFCYLALSVSQRVVNE